MSEPKNESRYRVCYVPCCKSTTISTPEKIFLHVPKDKKIRETWLCKARRGGKISEKSILWCCEDHFDIKNDMENYLQFSLMGGKKILKRGVVPHIFACQTSNKAIPRSASHKRNNKKCTKEFMEETRGKTTHLDNDLAQEPQQIQENHEGRTPEIKYTEKTKHIKEEPLGYDDHFEAIYLNVCETSCEREDFRNNSSEDDESIQNKRLKIKLEENSPNGEAFPEEKWLIKQEQLHEELIIEEKDDIQIKEENTFDNETMEEENMIVKQKKLNGELKIAEVDAMQIKKEDTSDIETMQEEKWLIKQEQLHEELIIEEKDEIQIKEENTSDNETKSENQGGLKRKRSKKTTTKQYEAYLQFMEADIVFRINAINPLLKPDYLIKKWQQLAAILNSIGNGPDLKVVEWKKRFADWKYSTINKFRKIKESARRTGGGPKLNLELTPVEQRGLVVWGKVTKESAGVTECEGIKQPLKDPNITKSKFDDTSLHKSASDIIILDADKNIGSLEVSASESASESEGAILISEGVSTAEKISTKQTASRMQGRRKRHKPLSLLAENLIQATDSAHHLNQLFQKTVKSFCKEYLSIENRKLQLKDEKFRFKIAKFKFKHRELKFDV